MLLLSLALVGCKSMKTMRHSQKASRNAFIAIDPATLEEPMKGSISDLSREELDLVEKFDEPVGESSGVYFANIVNCPISVAERGVYALNQDERHEGRLLCLQP